ncbi:MAG: cache domain-containing protein, partial [bacterium]
MLLVAVAVGPGAVRGGRLLGSNREGLQGLVLDYHAQQAQALAQSLETEISHLLSRVGFLIGSQVVARLPWEDKKALLEEFLRQNPDIATVSLVSPTGDELVKQYNEALEPNPALIPRAKDAAFLAMRKSKKVEVGTAYFEGAEKQPRLNIACPLEQGRTLFVVVSLSRLAETVTRTRFRKTGMAILVDRDGRVLAHPDTATVETSGAGLGIVRAGLTGQAAGSQEFVDESGVARVGAFARIPSMGWGVLVQQDRAEAFNTATVIKRQAITAIVVAAVAALLVALFAARRLSRPILEVTGGAERVAQGDFTVSEDVQTGDELSRLAKTFNVMVRRLQAYNELQIDRLVVEQNKMEAILFSIEDGILMTDFTGRLLLLNEQARTMLR